MTKLIPSIRLKVKRDTFFLPDPNSGVYFRNNVSSFHMKGSTIDQWVNKLLPMFNGEYTLENLTNGLPVPYRNRVYEIAEVLYKNGFVRDISGDRPHQLSDQIVKKYESQIGFIESFTESGAYRFQTYRQANVLAIGSGSIFVSLVSSLLESGLPKFHVFITESVPTNRLRLEELVVHARQADPEVRLEEVMLKAMDENDLRELVKSFDFILYVSQEGELEELKAFHEICRGEKRVFLPAICLRNIGLAGPLVHPDSDGCFESAWRSLHQTVFNDNEQQCNVAPTACAMLANLLVFELFKKVTGVTEDFKQQNQIFLLDLNTLEGKWHPFMPHPLVTGRMTAKRLQEMNNVIEQSSSSKESGKLLLYFSQLTSEKLGILYLLEEGDLKQLPLAQCRVQVVDPLSAGPAKLLPSIVCSALTHEQARKEAGLSGIEAYVSRMLDLIVMTLPLQEKAEGFVGVGAGETGAEGVCRALQKCLTEELNKQRVGQRNVVTKVQLHEIDDIRCRYYLQALTTLEGVPTIGFGEEIFGFPVVWVGANDRWYRSVGLNTTMALQHALQQAIMKEKETASVLLAESAPRSLIIPSSEAGSQADVLQSAIQMLESNRQRLSVFELSVEPFLTKEFICVYGTVLREEETG